MQLTGRKPWLAFLFTVLQYNENVKTLSHLTPATPVMHLLYFFSQLQELVNIFKALQFT